MHCHLHVWRLFKVNSSNEQSQDNQQSVTSNLRHHTSIMKTVLPNYSPSAPQQVPLHATQPLARILPVSFPNSSPSCGSPAVQGEHLGEYLGDTRGLPKLGNGESDGEGLGMVGEKACVLSVMVTVNE